MVPTIQQRSILNGLVTTRAKFFYVLIGPFYPASIGEADRVNISGLVIGEADRVNISGLVVDVKIETQGRDAVEWYAFSPADIAR
jgi:hypothetical protein